jgi:hypothetical protein
MGADGPVGQASASRLNQQLYRSLITVRSVRPAWAGAWVIGEVVLKITYPVPRRDNDLVERSCRGQREHIQQGNCAGSLLPLRREFVGEWVVVLADFSDPARSQEVPLVSSFPCRFRFLV